MLFKGGGGTGAMRWLRLAIQWTSNLIYVHFVSKIRVLQELTMRSFFVLFKIYVVF